MEVKSYDIRFQLSNGSTVLTTYESDKEIHFDMYLEVMQSGTELLKVKDRDGVLHNIYRNHIVEISITENSYFDPSVLDF